MRLSAIPLFLAYATMTAASCVPTGEPLTAEDRCVLLCEGNQGSHPCVGEEPDEDCVADCAAHISPLEGECLTCVITQSGWMGRACVCTDVDPFGNVDVECDECSYTTYLSNCAESTTCQRDEQACDGFLLVDSTDPICADACGP